ncbi:DNA cytosine methyltransferase [uncultured Fibrobacter sp.]|uniref:DNA cytosine methyltransferase n=1 Tax=uncultured Fibrobacter sp. TaxID=261512 RepID=UPI002609CB4D|nr:DNA cytosine methyltransferase [uncultured Fibrobacter sp.]
MKRLSYRNQKKLLDYSIKTETPFEEILAQKGLDYNSLVYSDESSFEDFVFPEFIPVNERKMVAPHIPCVSFFSGAGGLDVGFKYAGFDTIFDVEINEMFCDTLRANGAKKVLGPPDFSGNMQDYESVIARLEAEGVQKKFPGVFHGGPPCQSFSIAANQRFSKSGENFKRVGFQHEKYGNLLFCYINVIVHFLPETFLIENVDGLLSIDGGEQVRHACEILQTAGYSVAKPTVVNAADYGVPQKRMRTLIIGSRVGDFTFPDKVEKQIPSGSALKKIITSTESNVPRNHKAESISRYMILGFGQRDQLGRVDRLNPEKPSKTIIAGGTGGGGRSHLHPFIPRTMTVRECARLQTFPDDYVFIGPMARQFTQVGNAVPPVLGYEMACAIYNSIYR